ncbi:MAG TPA: DUF58 domain-containing protein [Anaeromyxobacter sp.]|nr:DUF58 domain-containing protein [Anaeromyxobacter sp.]
MKPDPSHPSLLDPKVLARLGTLHLRVRAITEGVLTGLHKSPHHGQSVEFAEHKEYAPGDEIRLIDWKAYGKFDKYYVKKFEQETNLRAYLVVDSSGSMGYRSDPRLLTKLEYASALSASLAYLLVRQQDAAGLVVVSGSVRSALPPRATAGHLGPLVEALAGVTALGPTDLGAAVDWVIEHAPRRSSVVVFSDLMDRDERVLRRLAQLGRRKHEVTLFHVLDPAELDFPFEDPTLFLSMEDERRIEANGRDMRKGYLELFRRWLEEVRRAALESDVDYVLCRTDTPVDEVLLPFLARRERTAA